MSLHDKLVNRVRLRLERGESIETADAIELAGVRDLTELARIARLPRERRHGRRAYHIAGVVVDGEELVDGAATYEGELVVRLRETRELDLDAWLDLLRQVGRGGSLALSVSPRFLRDVSGGAVEDGLRRLAAVASSLVVTAEEAEISDPLLRSAWAPGAMAFDEWVSIHRRAHAAGFRSVAGISYGVVDHPEAFGRHLEAIRRIQEETAGFVAFAPMAIHNPQASDFYLAAPTALQTFRAVTIARAYLDAIPHIVVAPALVTLEIAVVAMSYGADLVDRTIQPADVHASEPEAAGERQQTDLAVLSSRIGSARTQVGAEIVHDRLIEARWRPTAVDVTVTPAADAPTIQNAR